MNPDKAYPSRQPLELYGAEAISSLSLLWGKQKFSQKKQLIISAKKELKKLKAFLLFKHSAQMRQKAESARPHRDAAHPPHKKAALPFYDLPPFPAPGTVYAESVFINRRKWQTQAALPGPGVFLASPSALLKKTNISSNTRFIEKGGRFDSALLLADYKQKAFAESEGEFASRGIVWDVFSPTYSAPLRIQMEEDRIQSIHQLDKEFKRRQTELEKAFIPSPYEWLRTGEDTKKLFEHLREQEQNLKQKLPLEFFKLLNRKQVLPGFEGLLNALDSSCSLDSFAEKPQIWVFDPDQTQADFLQERQSLKTQHSFWTQDNLFVSWDQLYKEQAPFDIENSRPPGPRPRAAKRMNKPHNRHDETGACPRAAKNNLWKTAPLIQVFKSSAPQKIQNPRANPVLANLPKENTAISPEKKLLKEFSSRIFKRSAKGSLKEELKNLPVFQLVFVGPMIADLKKRLMKEGILDDESYREGMRLKKRLMKEGILDPKNPKSARQNGPELNPADHATALNRPPPQSPRTALEGGQTAFSSWSEKPQEGRAPLVVSHNKEWGFFEGKSLIFMPSSSSLKESFFCPLDDTAYLRAEDFLPQKTQSLAHFDFFRKRARALEFSQMTAGDLAVHRQYGIGQFEGLKTLQLYIEKEDFIVMSYKGGDKLFVPAYKASEIKRYSRKRSQAITDSLLDRLGNPRAWERKMARAEKHIHSLTLDLIELYRLRKQKQRPPFKPAETALKHFASDFPFIETPDQKRVIQELMNDMSRPQPMDRLLTADTGFGKTETALRACFRALENGFQVCWLAPTTVLALQHFKNFQERFKNTAFKIGLLNRFVPLKKREEIFQLCGQGRMDFLIATHSAFSPKLSFKDLRLLILDEEHRFGVRQKDRLLRWKKNLDVLSLSATPIPRTLNMALTGIKDISVIKSPPKGRAPVKITMRGWDTQGIEQDILTACRKEKDRGGQILFVHNRVKSLYQRAEWLKNLLPDFKIAVARGQMEGLEKIIIDFFEKKYDLLVSTNIIESGMDMPEANTMFIDRAHEMGLSQIYQLKGRTGRSKRQAFCYLLFPETHKLSVLARERLELLQKYAGMGDSLQLALRDLENRGAGALFGAEQSGHIQSLGEELYFEILNEKIQDQKHVFIEPEIRLPFPAGIPRHYIPDARLRLLYYKNLSETADEESLSQIKLELREEFGPPPEELKQLFFLLDLRGLCKKLLIKDLRLNEKSLSLSFHEKTKIAPQSILKILNETQGEMTGERSLKIPVSQEKPLSTTHLLQRLMDQSENPPADRPPLD